MWVYVLFILDFQVVARHEDLLAQATGIESLEGMFPLTVILYIELA